METSLDTPVTTEDEIPLFAVIPGIIESFQFGDTKIFGKDLCGLRDKHIHPDVWDTIESVQDYTFYTIMFKKSVITFFMKHIIFASLGFIVIGFLFAQCTSNRSSEYKVLNTVEEMSPVLEKVLEKLVTVQNVEYISNQRFWNDWKDEPETWDRTYRCIVAYNPEDPFTNAKYVYWNIECGNYVLGYDGIKRIRPYGDNSSSSKVFEVDYHFNHPEKHRIRVVSNPFFYEIGDILEYTLNTTDSIQVKLTEDSDTYIFELMTLDPGVIVEFGCAHLDPHGIIPPGIGIDETRSLYRVKISKADMLPFDLEECRAMERMNRYVISDIKPLDNLDFDIEKSLPEGYTFYNSSHYCPVKVD